MSFLVIKDGKLLLSDDGSALIISETNPPSDECCCKGECTTCLQCPGPGDRVWVVLDGTANDGTYEAEWDPINSWWVIDFIICETIILCNSDLTGLNFSLFDDQTCPIGGRCDESGPNPGSPLIITPAPDCDNCDMNLPSGTLAIHWTCGGGSMARMSAAPQMMSATTPSNDCIHRGDAIDTHECETCGNRGTKVKVYECELHGRCVLKNWTNDGRKRRESGETCCLTCPDKQQLVNLDL